MTAKLAQRSIVPELLDGLPEWDPSAVGSRRDLVWINALMFQSSIMTAQLKRNVSRPPHRILEMGCGDGTFMLAVAKRLARRWPDVELVLLDRADLVSRKVRDGFQRLGWNAEAITTDVFEWLRKSNIGRFDIITANLFLHHFTDEELATLLAVAQALAPVFVATEPQRSSLALGATRLLGAIGANKVTLHDAATSVRAGFAGNELSALWPKGTNDRLGERRIGPFTHVFSARRMAEAVR
ncbi:MAG TPA: methyltransferase domain-containing protein [Arsenicitalea sp.]|jgi:2-polyprenyl-3-methyl-5-hydroxy-6-metoxy-1,4-benzoquinol methylase|nr:methyltransferase domain-containing protein [Arsenicitalea sp.]